MAIGQETKFEFNHTKDLVGGWTSKLDMEVMEVAGTVADTEITISNGDTSFFISKDGGSIHDNNVVPGCLQFSYLKITAVIQLWIYLQELFMVYKTLVLHKRSMDLEKLN